MDQEAFQSVYVRCYAPEKKEAFLAASSSLIVGGSHF
jgi:hypothetical protein